MGPFRFGKPRECASHMMQSQSHSHGGQTPSISTSIDDKKSDKRRQKRKIKMDAKRKMEKNRDKKKKNSKKRVKLSNSQSHAKLSGNDPIMAKNKKKTVGSS